MKTTLGTEIGTGTDSDIDNLHVLCQTQLPTIQHCGCSSSHGCKMPFSNNHHRTLQGESLLFIGPRNYPGHLGPHSAVEGRVNTHRSAFIGVMGAGLGFGGLSLHW